MSKVKCFACQGYGHYVGQCPHKKKSKNKEESEAATSAEVREYAKNSKRKSCLSQCFQAAM